MRAAQRSAGFSLIELVVAMALVAILAAIALPTYREHVRKSRRAEAQSYLMAVAARQQQFLVDTRAYAANLGAVGLAAPTAVAGNYDVAIAITNGPPPTFTVSAVPKAGTDQTQERCGTLTVDQSGVKGAALSSCW